MKKTNQTQNGNQYLLLNMNCFSVFKISLVLIIMLSFSACKKVLVEDQKLPSKIAGRIIDQPFQVQAANDNSFKVMSFNTRHHSDSDPHSITYRQTRIRQIIIDNTPDIVGLQEYTDASFKTWFSDEMAILGYGEYNDGSGSPKVIYFKNNRFTLQNSGTRNISSGSGSRRASWVTLLDQATSKQYFICNSHWQHDSASERLINAQNLVSFVNEKNTGNLPEIVFGDFNGQQGTAEINYLKSGLNVVDALMEDENTFHGWDASGTKKLDWIMSTKNMAVLKWDVIRTSYSGVWPSDHFPVMATFIPGILGSAISDAVGSENSETKFCFGDVDGDGDLDKILWRYNLTSGVPRVYLSNGNGTFSSSYIGHTTSASTLTSTTYYTADVNGDGKSDLILWNPNYSSGNTRVYLATSGGSFSSSQVSTSGSQSTGSKYYFADVNGDGKADRIFWNPTNNNGYNRVYFGTSTGAFNTSYILNTNASSESVGSTYYYADINGDGKSDKILWHPGNNDGDTMVYLSNGDGQFTLSSAYSSAGPSTTATTRYYFADVNGDGRADKIFWRPDAYLGKTKIYLSKSTGSFDVPIWSLRSASRDEATNFFFADINGDGKADQLYWNNAEYAGDFRNYLAL